MIRSIVFILLLIHFLYFSSPTLASTTARVCNSVTKKLTVVNESFTDILSLGAVDGCDVFVSNVQATKIVVYDVTSTVTSGATRIRIQDVTCIGPNDGATPCLTFNSYFDAPGAQIIIKRVKFEAAITNPWVVVGVPLGFKNIDLFSVSDCSLIWSSPASAPKRSEAQIVNCPQGLVGVKVVEIISNSIVVTSSVYTPIFRIMYIDYDASQAGLQQSARISFNNNKIIMTAATADIGVGLAIDIVGGSGVTLDYVALFEFQNNEISLQETISITGDGGMFVTGIVLASINNSNVRTSGNVLNVVDSKGETGGMFIMLVSCTSSSNSSFLVSNNTVNAKFTSTATLAVMLLRLTGAVSQLSSATFLNNNIQFSGAPSVTMASFFCSFSTVSNVGAISISGGRIQTASTVNSPIQVFAALITFLAKVDSIQNISYSQSSIFVQSVSSGFQQVAGVLFQDSAAKVTSIFADSCHFEYWAEVGSSATTLVTSVVSMNQEVEIRAIIVRNCSHNIKYSGNGNPQAVVVFPNGALRGTESIFLDRNEVKVSIDTSSVGNVQLALLFAFGSKLFGIENSSAPFNATLARRLLFPINITINNNQVIFLNPRFSVANVFIVGFSTNGNTPSASIVMSNNKIDSFCAYLNGTSGQITTAIAYFAAPSSLSGTDYPLDFQLVSNVVISRGIYTEIAIAPVTLLLRQLMVTTGKIWVQNNSIDVNFSAPNLGGLRIGQVTFTGPILMKDELSMIGNKFVATFCSDPSATGNSAIATLVVSTPTFIVDVGASLRVVGDLVQINGQPANSSWSDGAMVSIQYPIFAQNDQIDFPIHLENCTLIGNVDENYILHNTRGYNTKSLSQYELTHGKMELGLLRFALPGVITPVTTVLVKLIGNRINVLRCAVSEQVLIRFATFSQTSLTVSSLLIFNNSISVPTSASLFNPTTTSANQPNIVSRLFLAEIVIFSSHYANLFLKSAPRILNNTIDISRTGYTASSLVYPTSATKFDYSVDAWNRVAIVNFIKAAPFSVATPFEISGNRITATMEEANSVGLVIAKIWDMDLTVSSDSSPALLMESNVIEIGKLESFYHAAVTSIFYQDSVGVNSVQIKRSNNQYDTAVISINNNSLVISSFLRSFDVGCAIFVATTDSLKLPSISMNNNFLSVRSIVATGIASSWPLMGILVVVCWPNATTNKVDLQKFSSVANLEVQNNFLEFGSCSTSNSSAGVCEIAITTIGPDRTSDGALNSPMSIGRNVTGGNVVSGTLFLKTLSNNTIKLMSNNNNNNAQSSPIINSTEFYCFAIRVEYMYSISGASNIFGNRISLTSASTNNNNSININSNAVQRNSIYSSKSQIGIVSFSKCVNKCFVKNNTLETSGLYFFSFSSSSTPSKIYFFIAQINASTREFIAGLQQHNFILEKNSIKISTNSSNENNNNIQTSILRLFDAPPTRLMLISSSSSISFDPTTQSSSVDPISILLFRNEIYSVVFTLQPTSSSSNVFTAANKNDGIVNFLFLSTQGSVDLEEFRILVSLNNNTEVSGSSSTSAMIGINRRNVSVNQLQTAESQLVQQRKSKAVKKLATSSSFSLSGNRLIKWPLKPNKIRASSIVEITARGSDDVLISSSKYSSALAQDSFWAFGCNYWTSDIQKQFLLRTLFEMDDRQFKFNCLPFSWSPTRSSTMSMTSKSVTPSVQNSLSSSLSRRTLDSSSSFSPTSSLSASVLPRPYISSLRVIYDTATTVTSLLSVATLSTTAAITAVRSRSALHHFNDILYGNCGLDEETLSSQEEERADLSSSPTAMKLSDGGYVTGLVAGNICVVVGIGIVWFVGNSIIREIETKKEQKQKKEKKTKKKGKHDFMWKLIDSHAHQMMLLFAILLLEPTLTAGATSFLGGIIVQGRHISAVPIVCVFLAWILLLMVGLMWPMWSLVYRRSDRYDEFEETKIVNPVHTSIFPLRRFVHYMTDASGEWILLGEKEKHKRCFKLAVVFFEWYSPTFPKFIIVDILIVVCLSLAEVIGYIIGPTTTACIVRGAIVCAAFAVHILCMIYFRPVYTDRMSNSLSPVVEVISIAMIAGAMSMNGNTGDVAQIEVWSAVALTQSIFQSLVTSLELAALVLPIWDKILIKLKSKPNEKSRRAQDSSGVGLSEVMLIGNNKRRKQKTRRNKNKVDEDQEMELIQTPSPQKKANKLKTAKQEAKHVSIAPKLSRQLLESHVQQTSEL